MYNMRKGFSHWRRAKLIGLSLLLIGLLGLGCIKVGSSRQSPAGSCRPPCWHQIIPGQTTRDKVMEVLTDSNLQIGELEYHQASNSDPYDVYDTIRFDLLQPQDTPDLVSKSMTIAFTSDIVEYISISPSTYPLHNVEISEMIDYYGEPDRILAFSKDRESYEIDLLYLEGITIRFMKWMEEEEMLQFGDKALVDESANAISIIYSPPIALDRIEELLEVFYEPLAYADLEQVKAAVSPWRGVGLYDVFYFPNDFDFTLRSYR